MVIDILSHHAYRCFRYADLYGTGILCQHSCIAPVIFFYAVPSVQGPNQVFRHYTPGTRVEPLCF